MTRQLLPCGLYKAHRCAVIEAHHVVPKSWFLHAGLPIVTPMASICPNCHMDVHTGIDGLIAGADVTFLSPRAQKLAADAIRLAKEKGLTPTPTL